MAQFPSSLPFVSYLHYSPQGTSEESRRSQRITRAIKRDGFLNNVRVIDYAVERLAQEAQQNAVLAACFGGDVALIPVPRSSPLVNADALWPTRRICEQIEQRGLGYVLPSVVRTQPVQKSSTAVQGGRPLPPDHYDTLEVRHPLGLPTPTWVTVVDDVVTRGSTFLGLYPRLTAAYPGVDIRLFALIRTRSGMEVPHVVEVVKGTITFQHGSPHRSP